MTAPSAVNPAGSGAPLSVSDPATVHAPVPAPVLAPRPPTQPYRPARQHAAPPAPADLVFGQWLALATASLIILALAIRSGALAFVLQNDSTEVSAVIMVLYLSLMTWAGKRAWQLSREGAALQQLLRDETPCPGKAHAEVRYGSDDNVPSEAVRHLVWLRQAGTDGARREEVRMLLVEALHGPHGFGWFLTETVTKLGLLGTVLGFLIMLTALVGANQLELSAMQNILRDMAGGMGIKIIATVVGLIANLLLALQFILLDRAADKLIADVLRLAQPGDAAGHEAQH